ncbi:MAG: glycosyltransferase [Rhodopseudomonas sp.]|nr:glycosyltransferase [Rhodopseudomonas sp.]
MAAERQTAMMETGGHPAVSVVVPCFNGGAFLPQLLDSLARQTYRDFEIIIVDDGSTDPATRQALAALDPSIRVIRQNNKGLSAARNTGIAQAYADLVLPLDCDDMFAPPFLAEAVPMLLAAPADVAMVLCHKVLSGAAGGLLERHFNRFDLLFANPVPSGILLRKSCWQEAGGYDETMRDGYEDWEFYLRLMRLGYRGVTIPEPYLIYNVSSQGMLFNQSSGKHAAIWRVIRRKHAPAYRPLAMWRLWRASRDGSGRDDPGHVSLLRAIVAYLMAVVLPDRFFSMLIALRRRRLLLGGHRPAYTPHKIEAPPVT